MTKTKRIAQRSANMTGRQEYDRTKDRQRTLDKYMIDSTPELIDIKEFHPKEWA